MRVVAWVPEPVDTTPGQRFRIEQWDPYLRAEGIEITYSPFLDARLSALLKQSGRATTKAVGVLRALLRRQREALTIRSADLVYVFREDALLGPAWPVRIISARRIPFVFDFDDAVWRNYRSPANPRFSRLRWPSKTATYCRLARQVLAGNDTLRAYAEEAGGAAIVVPTTIETRTYLSRTRAPNPVPTIGWTGSYSTEPYLELIRPALEQLGRRRLFRLVVIGGGRFRLQGVAVEHRPWRSATEVADLSELDVGVMPLPDAAWERGKCGLKALQYMALEIPPVVSPVGVNRSIVQHGTNGFVAASTGEWTSALERLLNDESLRQRLGRAARERVEQDYAASVHGPRVAQLLRAAARVRGAAC